jgi:hypothetical protein
MARPVRFSKDDILDGAAQALMQVGPNLSIATIARQIDGPSGSIYHRFRSREELLIQLWLRSIRRFQVGFLSACTINDPHVAITKAASHIISYCREQPQDALAMTLYRHARLIDSAPAALKADVEHINDEITGAVADLCLRRYDAATTRHREILALAIKQTPYGIVRPYVGSSVPDWLDEAAIAAAIAIAQLGDNIPAAHEPGHS